MVTRALVKLALGVGRVLKAPLKRQKSFNFVVELVVVFESERTLVHLEVLVAYNLVVDGDQIAEISGIDVIETMGFGMVTEGLGKTLLGGVDFSHALHPTLLLILGA